MSFENREAWVYRMFQSYGFTPPPGVVAALTSTIPTEDQAGIASQEVGAYINAFNELQKAAANDPLQKLLVDEQTATTSSGAAATDYAAQLQDTYKQAPKLFGALTPDQIDQYLAPTKTAFDYGLGKISGEAAQRGVAGSSIEANSMAQAQGQFQQNVLNQGLNIGMTQQQNIAQVIQNLYNQKIAQQNMLYGLQQGTAGQISQQGYANAEFLAQLPILLQGNAVQAAAMNQKSGGSPFDIAMGTIGGGIQGAAAGFMAGGPVGAVAGGAVGGASGGYNASRGSMSMGSGQFQSSLPLLYGARNMTSASGVPGGMNWASQPGAMSSGFNSTAGGNEVWGPGGMAMLQGGNP